MTLDPRNYTDEQLEFLRACTICVKCAAEDGRVQFVNRRGNGFVVSGDGGNYLFMAYPGGRKILSVQGKEIMNYD